MCPDKQILSIYMDEELPSPWKEKLEAHLESCAVCADMYKNLKQLRKIFRNDTEISVSSAYAQPEFADAKNRVWQKLAFNRGTRPNERIWQRRLSIPLPAAAAAAVVITLIAFIALRGGQINNNNGLAEAQSNSGYAIAADYDIPGTIPAADINDVLRYLSSDSTDIIILTLPESQNFYRTGEPGSIRAADYNRGEGVRR